jgi:hypothetical protein
VHDLEPVYSTNVNDLLDKVYKQYGQKVALEHNPNIGFTISHYPNVNKRTPVNQNIKKVKAGQDDLPFNESDAY